MPEIEDDYFPNDFDGLNFDNIPGLEAPTTSRDVLEVSRPSILDAASPAPSTGSNCIEDMDIKFLAAVDALETHALNDMPARGGRPTHAGSFDSSLGELSSTSRKGKRKAEPQEEIDVRAILAGYETELTCPICCDLLVGAQVANPCGHTYCGECGYGWLAQNKYEPTCAVCRTSLCTRTPLLPNFTVDGFVRQHLQALARSGRPEWQERGYRTIEWNKRVESWKKQAGARAAQKKLKEATRLRRRQQFYDIDDFPYVPPWIIDGGTEDDEPLVPRVMSRRGTRSRR